METIAAYVDDAEHAPRLLQPLLDRDADARWVVVVCPPRLRRHASRWISHAERQRCREEWAGRLFVALEPLFARCPPDAVQTLLARGPLARVTERLSQRFGATLRVFDARRPRLGRPLEPLKADRPAGAGRAFAAPLVLSSGLSALLALSD